MNSISPEATPQGMVPLWFLSTALDEVYALRCGAAYEVAANRATAEMSTPKGLLTLLNSINEPLIAAARGQAHTVVSKRQVSLHRTVWEAQRGLRDEVETDHTYLADEDLYLAALAEIRAIRTVLRDVAKRMPDALLFKTLPASRRRIIEAQIDRMKAAVGNPMSAYSGTSTQVMRAVMTEAGASDRLTTHAYADEVAAR